VVPDAVGFSLTKALLGVVEVGEPVPAKTLRKLTPAGSEAVAGAERDRLRMA
jgi:hypothetical protein